MATAELLPLDESLGTVSCSAPAPHSAAPDAALVSLVDFTARDDYTAQMVWTLHMTNGDTIRLRQELHVALIHTYNYHPEDAPMETLADLQALVDELAETAEPYDKLNLFLPPVTYEGSLVMEERPINLYGSEENGRRTTFTGTLRVASRDSWITYIQGHRLCWRRRRGDLRLRQAVGGGLYLHRLENRRAGLRRRLGEM